MDNCTKAYKPGSTTFLFLLFIVMIYSGCVQNGGDKTVTTLAAQTTIEVSTTEATTVSITSTIPQMVGKPNGESCSTPTECSSFSCKDAVCCDKDQCGYLGKCYNKGDSVKDCVCMGGELMLCGTTISTIPQEVTRTTYREHVTTSFIDNGGNEEMTTTFPKPDNSLSEEELSYSNVVYAAPVGDKIAFFALLDEVSKTGSKEVVVLDGREYGKEYSTVYGPTDMSSGQDAVSIGGRLVYSALPKGLGNDENRQVVVYDGKEYGDQRYSASNPRDVNGKLAYLVEPLSDETGKQYLVYDGKEIGKEYYQAYDPVGVGGRIAYTALKNGEGDEKPFVVYDGKELTDYADVFSGPFSLAGKLCFSFIKGGKTVFYYDGKLIGDKYSSVEKPVMVGGKLAYYAEDDSSNFIVLDGTEGKHYLQFDDLRIMPETLLSVGGKVAYFVKDDTLDEMFFVLDAKESDDRYKSVTGPLDAGGQLVFIGEKEDGYILVHGNKETSLSYDEIVKDPMNLNGKYSFIARRGVKYYIVKEK